MDNTDRFREIITKIPFKHDDLSVVNSEENLELFEELFDIYTNSSPSEQSSMANLVRSDIELSYKLVHWIPNDQNSDPKRYIEYRLLSASIRNGMPDFRDDLLELVHLWDFAEENGLDANELFEKVIDINDSAFLRQVMDPQRRESLRF